MDLRISPRVADKLKEKHSVSHNEIAECFANRHGKFFTDTRANHATDPPTYWFVSETDTRRVLKVVFIRHPDHFAIKSAYEPKDGSSELYAKLCRAQ
ncbi:DUF4258 domain-containing protein [Lysobacter sp. F60174L2]|uniref:DUF4258 domain-containing protein n=1 Tax=Lysobacter sp. F60174L2 TaxID=3459295 RepID=UPI00403D8895